MNDELFAALVEAAETEAAEAMGAGSQWSDGRVTFAGDALGMRDPWRAAPCL